jgi:hypothetical protein
MNKRYPEQLFLDDKMFKNTLPYFGGKYLKFRDTFSGFVRSISGISIKAKVFVHLLYTYVVDIL